MPIHYHPLRSLPAPVMLDGPPRSPLPGRCRSGALLASSPRHARPAAWLLAAAVALTPACGYRFLAREARLPGGVTRVDVPIAKNRTGEPGIEGAATAAAIDALRSLARCEIGDRDPEATLRITLLAAEGRPRAVGGGVPQAFRATLDQEFVLEEAGSGRVLWRSGPVREEVDYALPMLVSGDDLLGAEDLRTRALVRAAARAAEEAVLRLLAGS